MRLFLCTLTAIQGTNKMKSGKEQLYHMAYSKIFQKREIKHQFCNDVIVGVILMV